MDNVLGPWLTQHTPAWLGRGRRGVLTGMAGSGIERREKRKEGEKREGERSGTENSCPPSGF